MRPVRAGFVEQRHHVGFAGRIGHEGSGAAAGLLDFGHHGIEARGRAAGDYGVQSLACETARKRGAEPYRGTYSYDDRNLLVAHFAFLHQGP
jgi:hypothetical protein